MESTMQEDMPAITTAILGAIVFTVGMVWIAIERNRCAARKGRATSPDSRQPSLTPKEKISGQIFQKMRLGDGETCTMAGACNLSLALS